VLTLSVNEGWGQDNLGTEVSYNVRTLCRDALRPAPGRFVRPGYDGNNDQPGDGCGCGRVGASLGYLHAMAGRWSGGPVPAAQPLKVIGTFKPPLNLVLGSDAPRCARIARQFVDEIACGRQ